MTFLYKTINHEIYVVALDIENTPYLHGSFKYRDSARRWAVANSNPNKRPVAATESNKDSFPTLSYTPLEMDNVNPSTGAAIKPVFPEPTAEQLEMFYSIHGEGAEYKINPDNGWPVAV